MHVKTSIAAAARLEFIEQSDFFRMLNATSNVSIEFYKNGAKVSEAIDVGSGYAERVPDGFDKIAITSQVTQTIQFVTRNGGDVRYDNLTGNIAISNVNGAFTNTAKTVTNASAQLVAANPIRRYLLIQNNDSSGDIFVRVDGGTASVSTGIKIAAGNAYELQGFAPIGAITAIGSIASNANIVVVEG